MPLSQNVENSLDSINKPKTRYKNGLEVTASQSRGTPPGLSHEVIIIPSTNIPVYGSMFIVDIREMNVILHNITLQFNISAISGLTGTVTNNPHFAPAFWLFTRIEILQNQNVIDTIYPTQQFIAQQFLEIDEDRLFINNCCGNYSSQIHRNTMATNTSNYLVNLRTYFDEAHLPILSNSHQIQLRVYMDTLANQVNQSSLTGTPVATLNFCNAICKVTRLDTNTAASKLQALMKQPTHRFFHDVRYGLFSAASGVSSAQIVLTPIVGKVALLFFVIRDTAALSGNNFYKFKAIKDFAILNAASTNIVGGQSIPSAVALQYLNYYWCQSSYTSETALGLTDNTANVYCWSFSSDPVQAYTNGRLLGSKQFTGAEQLQINFASALTAAANIDVYALTESMIEIGQNYVKKLSL